MRVAVCLLLSAAPALAEPPAGSFPVPLRSRVQPFKGSDAWDEVAIARSFDPKTCAVVLCDVWDDHWCKKASQRCGVLAPKIDAAVKGLRDRGVFAIHCPSDTMDFYKDSPARRRALDAAKWVRPKALVLPDPPLPVDSTDGGCDDAPPSKFFKAWSRQHPAVAIDDAKDAVTDKGDEVMNLLHARGITTVFVAGVHTNMCVLHRSFAIKELTRNRFDCVLVRDLTDSMYNPERDPKVSHDEGTELIVRHVEKHWCPTCLSKDLPGAKK